MEIFLSLSSLVSLSHSVSLSLSLSTPVAYKLVSVYVLKKTVVPLFLQLDHNTEINIVYNIRSADFADGLILFLISKKQSLNI